jgi:hypothetical protein
MRRDFLGKLEKYRITFTFSSSLQLEATFYSSFRNVLSKSRGVTTRVRTEITQGLDVMGRFVNLCRFPYYSSVCSSEDHGYGLIGKVQH